MSYDRIDTTNMLDFNAIIIRGEGGVCEVERGLVLANIQDNKTILSTQLRDVEVGGEFTKHLGQLFNLLTDEAKVGSKLPR